MDNNDESATKDKGAGARGFIASVLAGLVRDIFKLIAAFGIGTGGGAIVCWYYGLPLGLSIIGGILVLALAIALISDSGFF